eukprot:scaffold1837_cov242-Chaetoceros_neogracile.AAC.4
MNHLCTNMKSYFILFFLAIIAQHAASAFSLQKQQYQTKAITTAMTITNKRRRSVSLLRMTPRTVYLACDGFGQPLQDAIEEHLTSQDNVQVQNLGSDTYYDAAAKVATHMQKDKDPNSFGVLFCGTGMGVGIVANKFKGIRAATCENTMTAKYARAVNNANVLCLGNLVTPPETAKQICDVFMKQGFVDHPTNEEGEKVEWWSEDVETFLKSSMDGVENVENQAQQRK